MANSKKKCTQCKRRKPVVEAVTNVGMLFLCSDECRIAYAMSKPLGALSEKRREQQKQAKRQITKQKAEKLTPRQAKKKMLDDNVSHQRSLTQDAINSLVRAVDANQPCISCGTTSPVQYCGGHFKTRGAHPELRYDLRNIHKQCNRHCNMAKSGNIERYRCGLIARYGRWIVEYLDSHHEPKAYTCDQLRKLRAWARKKTREIERGRTISRDELYLEWDALHDGFNGK